MATLSLNVNLQGKTVFVAGGGKVALRKVQALLATEATVRLASPTVCPELTQLAAKRDISVRIGCYLAVDLEDVFMAVAATNDKEVNRIIATEAGKRGILVMVADNPLAGNCTFPAVLHCGSLEIAVSTGGRCPTFATDIRDMLADIIGEEYGRILDQLAAEREKLLTDGNSSTYNTKVLRSLARRLIAELTERKDTA